MTLDNSLTLKSQKNGENNTIKAVNINYDCVKRMPSIKYTVNKEYNPPLHICRLWMMIMVPT